MFTLPSIGLRTKKEVAFRKRRPLSGARRRKLMTTIQLEFGNARVPIKDSVGGLKFRGEPESAVVHGINCQATVISPARQMARRCILYATASLEHAFGSHKPSYVSRSACSKRNARFHAIA